MPPLGLPMMPTINSNISVNFNQTFIFLANFSLALGGVHKLRLQEEGGRWSKKLTFCKLLYHRKCKQRGVGGQKKPNFVNIVCERPLNFLPPYPWIQIPNVGSEGGNES